MSDEKLMADLEVKLKRISLSGTGKALNVQSFEVEAKELIKLVRDSDSIELELLKNDAARYRYLRESFRHSGRCKHRLEWYLPRRHGEGVDLSDQLDDCIDDARLK